MTFNLKIFLSFIFTLFFYASIGVIYNLFYVGLIVSVICYSSSFEYLKDVSNFNMLLLCIFVHAHGTLYDRCFDKIFGEVYLRRV